MIQMNGLCGISFQRCRFDTLSYGTARLCPGWQRSVGQRRQRPQNRLFTGTIATGLSLVAIVVGGLMFAYDEGQSIYGV